MTEGLSGCSERSNTRHSINLRVVRAECDSELYRRLRIHDPISVALDCCHCRLCDRRRLAPDIKMPVYHLGQSVERLLTALVVILKSMMIELANIALIALFKLKEGADPVQVQAWQDKAQGMVGQVPGDLPSAMISHLTNPAHCELQDSSTCELLLPSS